MKQTFSISTEMFRLNVSVEQAEGVLAREAARQIAFALPLPASGLPDDVEIGEFYDANHGPKAEAMLGQINESAACDFDVALSACKHYWMARYSALHDPASGFADFVQQQVDPTIVEVVSPAGQPIESLESMSESIDIQGLRNAVSTFLKTNKA